MMKVLVNRSLSIISARLVLLADRFHWSARTEEMIIYKLVSFLYARRKDKPIHQIGTPIRNYLTQLPPGMLKKLLQLSTILCDVPEFFDLILSKFRFVPVVCLEHYLIQEGV